MSLKIMSLNALTRVTLFFPTQETPLGSIQEACSPENNNRVAPPNPTKGILGDRLEKNSLLSFSYSMNSSHGESPKEIISAVTRELALTFG